MSYVPLRKAVEILGLHPNTLRKYGDEGKIKMIKNEAGQRLYDAKSYIIGATRASTICYCRVSSAKQRDDLTRQVEFMQNHYPAAEVIKDSYSISILNWYPDDKNLVPFCPNVLGAAVETQSSKDTTKFSWTAFKWSTSTPDQVEKQTITCTISLSETEPVINTPGCESDFDNQSSEGNLTSKPDSKISN